MGGINVEREMFPVERMNVEREMTSVERMSNEGQMFSAEQGQWTAPPKKQGSTEKNWRVEGNQELKNRYNNFINWDRIIQNDSAGGATQGMLTNKIAKQEERTIGKWLRSHRRRKKQAKAFSDYTRNRYYKILNTSLRKQTAPKVEALEKGDMAQNGPTFYKNLKDRYMKHQIKSRVKEMDRLMEEGFNSGEHNRTENSTVVYRGINGTWFRDSLFQKVGLPVGASTEELSKALKSKNLEFSDNAYMSTSLKRDSALAFAQQGEEPAVLIEGIVPAGMKSLYITPLIEKKKGEFSFTEYELLLNKNSCFRVSDVYEEPSMMGKKPNTIVLRGRFTMAKMGAHRKGGQNWRMASPKISKEQEDFRKKSLQLIDNPQDMNLSVQRENMRAARWREEDGWNQIEDALLDYTQTGYMGLNSNLRAIDPEAIPAKDAKPREIDPHVLQNDKLIQEAFHTGKETRMEEDTVVYRGIQSEEFKKMLFQKAHVKESDGFEGLAKALKSKEIDITERGYMSTSLSNQVASKFSVNIEGGKKPISNDRAVVIKGIIPKGMKGLYLTSVIANTKKDIKRYDEKELLLNKGTRFRIYDAENLNGVLILKGRFVLPMIGNHRPLKALDGSYHKEGDVIGGLKNGSEKAAVQRAALGNTMMIDSRTMNVER